MTSVAGKNPDHDAHGNGYGQVRVYAKLTLVQGFQNEISSDLVGEIERVLLKTNVNTHSMLGSYTVSYDNLLYSEYTREFSCAYSHVHIGTKIPKLGVSETQKMRTS